MQGGSSGIIVPMQVQAKLPPRLALLRFNRTHFIPRRLAIDVPLSAFPVAPVAYA